MLMVNSGTQDTGRGSKPHGTSIRMSTQQTRVQVYIIMEVELGLLWEVPPRAAPVCEDKGRLLMNYFKMCILFFSIERIQ